MTDSFDRIAFANPAPQGTDLPGALMSTTALLDIIDERAATMPVETKPVRTRETDKPTMTRRGWLTAAVAFGIVLIIGTIFIVLSRQSQEIPPATEITTTTVATETTEATEALSPEMVKKVARADEIIAIWNEGDLTKFANLFQESAGFGGNVVSSSNIQRHFALSMALGEQRTGECVPHADMERVSCELTAVNDFGGPLGVSTPISWTFTLADSGRITQLGSTEIAIDAGGVIWEMILWLTIERPDVFDTLMSELNMRGPGIGEQDEVAKILLEYRDEFVAQSGEYSYTG